MTLRPVFETTIESTPDEKEFGAAEYAAAEEYIASLPENVDHLYVDVKTFGGRWVFLFGDDRRSVPKKLKRTIGGHPFRVRGARPPGR